MIGWRRAVAAGAWGPGAVLRSVFRHRNIGFLLAESDSFGWPGRERSPSDSIRLQARNLCSPFDSQLTPRRHLQCRNSRILSFSCLVVLHRAYLSFYGHRGFSYPLS